MNILVDIGITQLFLLLLLVIFNLCIASLPTYLIFHQILLTENLKTFNFSHNTVGKIGKQNVVLDYVIL